MGGNHLPSVATQDLNHVSIYTDGSMGKSGVGAAAVCEQIVKATSLSIESSVFSAEMHAICMTLDIVSLKYENNKVIFSDSLSAVKCLHVHC